jgi:hypothetical protein
VPVRVGEEIQEVLRRGDGELTSLSSEKSDQYPKQHEVCTKIGAILPTHNRHF